MKFEMEEMIKAEIIIDDFISLVCSSSPLAWCSGIGLDNAQKWEIRGVGIIKKATEFMKEIELKKIAPEKRSKKTGGSKHINP